MPSKKRKKQLAVSLSKFSACLSTGVPVLEALEVAVEDCADSAIIEAFQSIAEEIGKGGKTYFAVRARPDVFPQFVVSMWYAGEIGGSLDTAIFRALKALRTDIDLN